MPYDTRLDRLLIYLQPEVLAPYREQADRYEVVNDYFEGKVSLTDTYFTQLDEEARRQQAIDIRFGYRTLENGELKLAAFGPDLLNRSRGHVTQWTPFMVKSGNWLDYDRDARFSSWVRRYIEGSWDVDSGPTSYLLEEIRLINGLTGEAAGCRLFKVSEATISFPAAQNSHRYEDAHRDLYGLVLDGLDKRCIQEVARRLKRKVDVAQMRPLKALEAACPMLKSSESFKMAMSRVSKQRGLAAHNVRAPARPMQAFEEFSRDIEACLGALRVLRTTLERELKMDAKRCRVRQEALGHLPRIAGAPMPNYSINQAVEMKGKTVERVEVGSRQNSEGVHQSEVIIIHFTDGSIVGIDTGSNAGNFDCGKHPAGDFHVDFMVRWVPPRS